MFREIPENNKYKEQIREIFELCEKAIPEHGDDSSYFKEPVSEQEMIDWEEKNNIKIPESYKEWLRFTGDCRMVSISANLWGPSKFHQKYVPEDLVVIGEVVGDGEVICFSKSTGCYVSFFEGRIAQDYENFEKVLEMIMDLIDEEWEVDEDEIVAQLQKIKELKKLEE